MIAVDYGNKWQWRECQDKWRKQSKNIGSDFVKKREEKEEEILVYVGCSTLSSIICYNSEKNIFQ